jgi:hypothetical protein
MRRSNPGGAMMFYIVLVYLAAFAGGIGYAIFEDRRKA